MHIAIPRTSTALNSQLLTHKTQSQVTAMVSDTTTLSPPAGAAFWATAMAWTYHDMVRGCTKWEKLKRAHPGLIYVDVFQLISFLLACLDRKRMSFHDAYLILMFDTYSRLSNQSYPDYSPLFTTIHYVTRTLFCHGSATSSAGIGIALRLPSFPLL